MKKLQGNNINECVNNLLMMRKYKPFEYSGTFFLAFHDGQGYAYRTKKALVGKMASFGLESFEMAQIGGN